MNEFFYKTKGEEAADKWHFLTKCNNIQAAKQVAKRLTRRNPMNPAINQIAIKNPDNGDLVVIAVFWCTVWKKTFSPVSD